MFDTSSAGHDFNIDNGTFVVDASANRVGIGKTNPSTLLDVNGTATATTFVGALTGNVTGNLTGTILTAAQTNITSVGTLTALTVSGDLTIADKIIHSGDTDTFFRFAGANDIRIVAGNVEHAAFDGTIVFNQSGADMDLRVESTGNQNMLFVDAGNDRVGIGTNSPGFPLHVNSSGTDIAKFESSGSYTFTRFSSSSRNWALSIGSSFSIYDETGSQTLLTLDSSGNLSLGGTAIIQPTGHSLLPSLKLNNNGYIGSASATSAIQILTSGSVKFAENVGIGGSPDSDSGLHLKGDGKRILIDSTDENLVSLGRRGSSGAGLDKAYLRMRNAGTNTVVIDTDGATYFNGGNVGVNDNNPDRKVSIIGDNTSGGKYPLSLDATDTDYALEFRRSGTSEWWIKASASNFTVHENGVGDQLGVYGGSVKVFGLLGVNKSANPAVGLSVGADATTTSSYGLEVCNSSANTRFLVDGVGNSYFYKTDNNVGVKWDATNGRLGIGTGVSALSYALTVSGESSIGDFSANGFANLGRNADGNQDVTTLGGYGVDAGSGTRYGRYGALRFRTSANYTAGSRGYMITNGYGANKFAILQSSSATTMPSLGSYGGVSGGTAPFIMDNSGDLTFGYQPAAYGTIAGNISQSNIPTDYGLPLTTTYSRNITAQTNSTHGPGITITKAGVYIMSMAFLYDPVGTYIYVGWCVNGSMIHHWHSNHAISNNHDAHSSATRFLNVGDHLTIEKTTANNIVNIYGNTHSYWWVCKVG